MNTGVEVKPGVTKATVVKKHTLCKVPDEERWKVPLLHSLLAVKSEEFEIRFDDDDHETEDNEIGMNILKDICCN